MPEPHLAAAIDSIATSPFTGTAYRHVAAGRGPLSGAGARSQGGRWNPPQSFATIYLGLERETVIAEFHRLAARSRRAPQDFLPRHFYRYELALAQVLDLRASESRSQLSLGLADIASDDLTACQAIGETAHYLGYEAVLAPSATGAGQVLAVFSDRLRAGSSITDVDYEVWEAPPT